MVLQRMEDDMMENAMESMSANTAVERSFIYIEGEKDCKIHYHESCQQEAIR